MIKIRFDSIKVLMKKAETALELQDYDKFLNLLSEISFESHWLHEQLQVQLSKESKTIDKLINVL